MGRGEQPWAGDLDYIVEMRGGLMTRRSQARAPLGLRLQTGARRDHRRAAVVDRVDDLARIDSLDVDRRDPEVGVLDMRGRALAAAGQMALQTGQAAEAEPLLLDALALVEHEGDDRVAVLALSHLGWAAEAMGDHAKSTARHERAVAGARAAEDDWAIGIALNNYAIKLARAGDLERARAMLEESLLLGHRAGEPRAIALASGNLTEIALDAGDFDRADALITESLSQAREIHSLPMIAGALLTRAVISLHRGDIKCATAQVREAIEPTRSAYDAEGAASLLSVAGTIAAIRQEPIRAATLWAAADHARTQIGIQDAPGAERLRLQWHTKARAAVSDATSWDTAWATGAELSLDDALAFASTMPPAPAAQLTLSEIS